MKANLRHGLSLRRGGIIVQSRQNGFKNAKAVYGTIGGAFLEVAFSAEFVGEVGEAEHGVVGGLCEGVEGGRFHLDAQYAGGTMALDVACCLAERRVGRPGAAM
jgi:hypothetical protein